MVVNLVIFHMLIQSSVSILDSLIVSGKTNLHAYPCPKDATSQTTERQKNFAYMQTCIHIILLSCQ
jgi:hypothetical protein